MSKLWRVAVALTVAAVASTAVTTGAQAVTSGTVTGPVLSSEQHQNGAAIDWSRVAAGGSSLAIVEATDGGRYRNPWFGADFGGARAAGLVRGSYAVGRPAAPMVTTALQQADYYLARLGTTVSSTRTLPPVLDLETTGGLNRGQLVTWAQTFLLRLQSQTGRTPLLHTYSYFWQTALGAPDAFARYPLWLTGGDPSATPSPALRTPVQPAWFAGATNPALTVDVTADDASWSALQDGKTPSAWPDAPPGAPLTAKARAYAGAATVTWVPGDTGSTAVKAYHVTAEPGDLSVTVAGGITQAVVSGLVNGTAYTFTVTPENATAVGSASSPTPAVTPAATLGAVPRPVTNVQRALYTTNCMPPSNLVNGTTWTRTHPAPGVTLQEGQHRDARGRVRMHLLRVDVKNSHLRFAPLMYHVSDRRKLSVLANQRNLVAATNAGYFDLSSHAPLNPVVVNGAPVFGPSVTSGIAGFGPDGLLSTAAVAASGTVTGPNDTLPLAGWNASQPAEGVNAYSARWGAGAVPMPKDAVSRYVSGGVISSAVGRRTVAPATGYLLVARGPVAAGWLRSLSSGDPVGVRVSLTSSSRTPYSLAYAVGMHLVANGVAGHGFSCKKTEKLPARTAIGWTADRRQLLLLAVDNVPKSKAKLHGVEPDQLARIMHDLGAAEAYMFDGGGSTEMVVRPHAGARLSIRNHPSDGVERKMPLGFGIFRR